MAYPEGLTSPEIEIAEGGIIVDNKTKFADLKAMLDSSKDGLKMDAMKHVINLVAKGKDVSELFPAVVKNVAAKNLERKKLVYVYLVRYAEEQQDLALLSISTFQRGLKVSILYNIRAFRSVHRMAKTSPRILAVGFITEEDKERIWASKKEIAKLGIDKSFTAIIGRKDNSFSDSTTNFGAQAKNVKQRVNKTLCLTFLACAQLDGANEAIEEIVVDQDAEKGYARDKSVEM